MKKHSTLTCLLSLMCFLPGCTTYWYQEGKTFKECKRDRQECFNELQKYSTLQELGEYEFKFVENCMGQRGYRLVKEKELPFRVRREKPESSLHWKLRGLAGTLDEP